MNVLLCHRLYHYSSSDSLVTASCPTHLQATRLTITCIKVAATTLSPLDVLLPRLICFTKHRLMAKTNKKQNIITFLYRQIRPIETTQNEAKNGDLINAIVATSLLLSLPESAKRQTICSGLKTKSECWPRSLHSCRKTLSLKKHRAPFWVLSLHQALTFQADRAAYIDPLAARFWFSPIYQ